MTIRSLMLVPLAVGLVPCAAMAEPAPRPKLIVAIAVDQLSTDIFNEYRGAYAGGFKRLAGGVVFPKGHQGHAATETCPGHSTILTGSRPARTGIIANDWMNPAAPRKDAKGRTTYQVYCAEDPAIPSADGADYTVSGAFLRVPTMGDRMKVNEAPARVVSVSGKDRAAVMMGGAKADLTLWWNGKRFATYAGRENEIPAAINALSTRANAQIAKGMRFSLPPACQRYAREVKLSDTLSVGTLKPVKPGDERAWRASPGLDEATLSAAVTAMDTLKLGRGPGTDLLAVSFSATDYVGHSYGTSGAEMCHQIRALDGILGRLFAALDKTGVPYAVALTADHGGHDVPERNDQHGLPAAERVDAKLSAAAVGKLIGGQLGMAGSALLGRSAFGDIYLSPDVPKDKRGHAIGLAAAAYRSHPQVEAVFTRGELEAAPSPKGPVDEWSLIERAKASFDPERSGDLLVFLKPYVTPIPDTSYGYFATHGSPWGYDRRVPVIFWWKGVSGFEQPNAVETADIMPTLASLIGLPVRGDEIDGRCLDLLAGEQSNCGQ